MNELQEFMTRHPVALRATQSLKDGARIKIALSEENNAFIVKRQSGNNIIQAVDFNENGDAEISVMLSNAAAEEIIQLQGNDIALFGIRSFELILSSDAQRKMDVQFHVGPLTLITKGYLGILKAGGAKVMVYLAKHGLSNISKIKAAIKRRMT